MVTVILSILFAMTTTGLYAQFALVHDRDGYCFVRKNPVEGIRDVADKLFNGHIVYCLEREGNWVPVDYIKSKDTLSGYMYHDRLKPVSKYPALPVIVKKADRLVLSNGKIKVTIRTQSFSSRKHTLRYGPDNLDTIDGAAFWGTDGGIPAVEYHSICVTLGKREVILPAEATHALYQPTLTQTSAHYDEDTGNLYIQAVNSDGAGGYSVLWRVSKGRYAERVVLRGF